MHRSTAQSSAERGRPRRLLAGLIGASLLLGASDGARADLPSVTIRPAPPVHSSPGDLDRPTRKDERRRASIELKWGIPLIFGGALLAGLGFWGLGHIGRQESGAAPGAAPTAVAFAVSGPAALGLGIGLTVDGAIRYSSSHSAASQAGLRVVISPSSTVLQWHF